MRYSGNGVSAAGATQDWAATRVLVASSGAYTPLAASPAGSSVPRADVLILRLPGARVVLRPSGTEPKIKCYIEITEPLAGRSLPAARGLAAERLAPLRHALEALLADA